MAAAVAVAVAVDGSLVLLMEIEVDGEYPASEQVLSCNCGKDGILNCGVECGGVGNLAVCLQANQSICQSGGREVRSCRVQASGLSSSLRCRLKSVDRSIRPYTRSEKHANINYTTPAFIWSPEMPY